LRFQLCFAGVKIKIDYSKKRYLPPCWRQYLFFCLGAEKKKKRNKPRSS